VETTGLTVAVAIELDGGPIRQVGDFLAEVERFLPHSKPPATLESYAWMFEATGRLHRSLALLSAPPAPEVATFGEPERLRTELAATRSRVGSHSDALEIVDLAERLVGDLATMWISPIRLPQQVVHGDVRLGNVALTNDGSPAFFDFGFAARRPRVHELAYSLAWMVLRPDDSGTGDSFDWDQVPQLIAAYERGRGDAVLPVELKALPIYLAAVPLYLASIAGYTRDPAAQLRGEVPFLRIAEWVIANADEVSKLAAHPR
jgi:Ser/Thr protein kinase RdoA (MazF antagonist)